jgi:hypothetical protein
MLYLPNPNLSPYPREPLVVLVIVTRARVPKNSSRLLTPNSLLTRYPRIRLADSAPDDRDLA